MILFKLKKEKIDMIKSRYLEAKKERRDLRILK